MLRLRQCGRGSTIENGVDASEGRWKEPHARAQRTVTGSGGMHVWANKADAILIASFYYETYKLEE